MNKDLTLSAEARENGMVYFMVSEILEPNMSLEFCPPDRISLSGNLAESWRLWKQGFMLFMMATKSDDKAEKIKIAMLLDEPRSTGSFQSIYVQLGFRR